MNDQTGARILQVIEQERGQQRIAGDAAVSSTGTPSGLDAPTICPKLSRRELEAELTKRETMMRTGDGPGETDQWRVYKYIIGELQAGTRPLRLIVQASAGTGKSFLLTSVYLWCILNKHSCKAAAPTGSVRAAAWDPS